MFCGSNLFLNCTYCYYTSTDERNTGDKYEFPVTSSVHYASLLRMIVLLKLSMKQRPTAQSATPLYDKTHAGLQNRSRERSALIQRSNPRRAARRWGWGGGNVHSLRVWSHMREIRESRQQIRFSLHLAFNFAELGCRSSQQVGGGGVLFHTGVCSPMFTWGKITLGWLNSKT